MSIVQREENNDGWEEVCETYNEEKFVKNGLSAKFVQDNEVYSGKGVLRGFGINTKVLQTKLIRVLNGKIYDVVIDLRADSKTFMKSFCVELSAKNGKQLYIPEGIWINCLCFIHIHYGTKGYICWCRYCTIFKNF